MLICHAHWYFQFGQAQEGATERWGAKGISTFTWWIIPNSTCRSSPAQWGWIHNWELRTILLSTSHCMKTKQLSVVCHRQQPNQAQLPLESAKLRSLYLSWLSVTYIRKWSKAIYCPYARKRPGNALFTFRSKQWQNILSMKVCVNEAGHTIVYVCSLLGSCSGPFFVGTHF